MFASTFLITILGYFITEKIVEPQLGPYQGGGVDEDEDKLRADAEVTPLEKKRCFGHR